MRGKWHTLLNWKIELKLIELDYYWRLREKKFESDRLKLSIHIYS